MLFKSTFWSTRSKPLPKSEKKILMYLPQVFSVSKIVCIKKIRAWVVERLGRENCLLSNLLNTLVIRAFGRKSFKYCGFWRGQWDGSQVIFNGLWRCDKCFHKVFKNLYFASFQLQNWIALAPVHQQYVQGLTIVLFRKMIFLFVCYQWPRNRDQRTENWDLSSATCGLRSDTSDLSLDMPSLGSHTCFNHSEGYLSAMQRAEFQVVPRFST